MKVAICSDLHLEFGTIELHNEENANVLVLSGDIFVEKDLDMFDRRQTEMGFSRKKSDAIHKFFQDCCERFPHVIYIAGNHEHYHGDFKFTLSEIKKKLFYLNNLHVLDKEVFELDDYVFVGSTLWTDMNKECPMTLRHVGSMMNDFNCVKNSDRYTYRNVPLYKRKEDDSGYELDENGMMSEIGMKKKEEPSKFSTTDAVEEHKKSLQYIKHVIDNQPPWKTIIVVGHHAPSHLSVAEFYKNDTYMNGGYFSDLSEFILDNESIRLWTHGHTHTEFDYEIGKCRVVCNPRGYVGYEQRAVDFKLKYVEV